MSSLRRSRSEEDASPTTSVTFETPSPSRRTSASAPTTPSSRPGRVMQRAWDVSMEDTRRSIHEVKRLEMMIEQQAQAAIFRRTRSMVLRGWCAFALLTLSARADKHLDYLRLALNIIKLKERCDERKEEKKAKRLRGHMYKACSFAAMHDEARAWRRWLALCETRSTLRKRTRLTVRQWRPTAG